MSFLFLESKEIFSSDSIYIIIIIYIDLECMNLVLYLLFSIIQSYSILFTKTNGSEMSICLHNPNTDYYTFP